MIQLADEETNIFERLFTLLKSSFEVADSAWELFESEQFIDFLFKL